MCCAALRPMRSTDEPLPSLPKLVTNHTKTAEIHMACDHFPARRWHDGLIGVVLGFGAGALISSILFELTAEGFQLGRAMPLTLGIAAGALAFFFADRARDHLLVDRGGRGVRTVDGGRVRRVSGHRGTIRGIRGRFRRRSAAGHARRIDDSRGHDQGRRETGLAAVLGFALTAGLSAIS